jgi:hypothetical protein
MEEKNAASFLSIKLYLGVGNSPLDISTALATPHQHSCCTSKQDSEIIRGNHISLPFAALYAVYLARFPSSSKKM